MRFVSVFPPPTPRRVVTPSLRHFVTARAACAVGMLAIPALTVTPANASAFTTYGNQWRAIAAPNTGPGSFGFLGDALADGRIMGVTGNSVYVESGVGTGAFNVVANFDAAQSGGSADPSFVRVSPGGTNIAVGLGFGKPVAVFATSALGTPGSPSTLTSGVTGKYFSLPHYQGAWANETQLAITSSTGPFGSQSSAVSLLTTNSSTASPTNPTIISGITGASGGIAFDSAGRLYTGNGTANGGSPTATGAIKAFDASVLTAPSPLNFNTHGTLIGKVLSGDALAFDTAGNLFVGGGDFGSSDNGYFGLINAAAITAALGGGPALNPADPTQLRTLFPDGTTFGYYGSAFNRITGEIYATATNFMTGGNTFYASVPAPSAAGLLALGVFAARRRR